MRRSHITQHHCGYCKLEYLWGYMRVLWCCCDMSYTAHAVAAEYPSSTLKGTPTWSSHSSTTWDLCNWSEGIWMCTLRNSVLNFSENICYCDLYRYSHRTTDSERTTDSDLGISPDVGEDPPVFPSDKNNPSDQGLSAADMDPERMGEVAWRRRMSDYVSGLPNFALGSTTRDYTQKRRRLFSDGSSKYHDAVSLEKQAQARRYRRGTTSSSGKRLMSG